MRLFNSIVSIGGFLMGATWASLSQDPVQFIPYTHAKSYYESRVNLAEPEQFRIQKHLEAVESDLRLHTPTGLTVEQKKARAQRLDALHEYWVRGEFPKNRDYPDSLVPYFIDAEGVPCAVGYLVIVSGHKDFAEDIVRKQNHAYIREIKDPRLARWAKQSGLTLEECAHIQPTYGPPTIRNIRHMDIDSSGKIWVVGPDANNAVGDEMAFWQTNSWTFYNGGGISSSQCLCVTYSGQPLVGTPNGILWAKKTFSSKGTYYSCSGFENNQFTWMGSNQGIVRINVLRDTLVEARYLTPFSNTTVSVVAATQTFAWAGTPVGLAGRNIQSGAWMTRDSTTLSGIKVTGLKAGKVDTLWVGMDAPSSMFTGKGLRLYTGQTWLSYRTNNSALPSDTVQSLLPKSGSTVWIACASGLYEFTPPSGIRKVTTIVGGQVIDMVSSSQGILYLATPSNGVYRIQNDSPIAMGYPVPILAQKTNKKNQAMAVNVSLDGQLKNAAPLKTVSGRRSSDASRAAGVYVTPSR